MIFTIDFDNTCAYEDFPNIGENVPYAVETLKKIVGGGHQIILWTCRRGESLERAVEWFKSNNIPLSAVNEYTDDLLNGNLAKTYGVPRKVLGDYNIDDKNFGTPTRSYYSTKTNKYYQCVDWFAIDELLKAYHLIS